MSKNIPTDAPLSEEDRAYLLMRGEAARVDWFDLTYPAPEAAPPADEDADEEAETEDEDADDEDEDDEDDEDPEYENWTIADLKAEIESRNKKAGADAQMSVTGVKADLAARLREDDAAKA